MADASLYTSCEKCTFRNELKCDLNLLDTFQSVEVVENPEGSEFCIIHDEVCPMYRDKDKWKPEGDRIEAIKKELYPTYSVIFVIDHTVEDWSLVSDKIKEIQLYLDNNHKLFVILHTGDYRFHNKFTPELFDVPYEIITVYDSDVKNNIKAIDLIVNHVSTKYYIYVSLDSDIEYLQTVIGRINAAALKRNFVRLAHTPGDIGANSHQMVVRTDMHKFVGGTGQRELIEKIITKSREDKMEHLVWTI